MSDGQGNGESGAAFELDYLGFSLEVVWTRQDFDTPGRLWRISFLLAAHLRSSFHTYVIIDDENITKLQESFQTTLAWSLSDENLQRYQDSTNSHVRCQLGEHQVDDINAHDDMDLSGTIGSTMCPTRGVVGLGLAMGLQ